MHKEIVFDSNVVDCHRVRVPGDPPCYNYKYGSSAYHTTRQSVITTKPSPSQENDIILFAGTALMSEGEGLTIYCEWQR